MCAHSHTFYHAITLWHTCTYSTKKSLTHTMQHKSVCVPCCNIITTWPLGGLDSLVYIFGFGCREIYREARLTCFHPRLACKSYPQHALVCVICPRVCVCKHACTLAYVYKCYVARRASSAQECTSHTIRLAQQQVDQIPARTTKHTLCYGQRWRRRSFLLCVL